MCDEYTKSRKVSLEAVPPPGKPLIVGCTACSLTEVLGKTTFFMWSILLA